ncbi:hypothetical protein P4B35_22795 [Pontiellaceae bacterium B12227]|nr:hypothetical protein [Pontiellaceae bacterium B12227]
MMDYYRIFIIGLLVFGILLLRQWMLELFKNARGVLPSSSHGPQYNLFAWILIFIATAGLIRLINRF